MPKASPRATRGSTSRAGNKNTTAARTKVARTTTAKARTATAMARGKDTAAIKANRIKGTTTAKQATSTLTKATRQATAGRRSVGGRTSTQIIQDIRTAFQNAFADRKGQARGAAMRGPTKFIGEIEQHISALERQTANRLSQLQKLQQELAGWKAGSKAVPGDAGWQGQGHETVVLDQQQNAGTSQEQAEQNAGPKGAIEGPGPKIGGRKRAEQPQAATAE